MNFTTRENLTTRRHVGRNGSILWIIIHTMEALEGPQTAENVANYFKNVDASAHWCFDNNSRVRVVLDKDTAWTTPGANSKSLNYELAGYARQTVEDWNDEYSIDMLEIVAYTAAEDCIEHNIPIRRLTEAQIKKGEKGFGGHVDFNKVFKQSNHWDPGPNFPWDYFLKRVKAHKAAIEKKVPVESNVKPKPTWNNYGYTQEFIKARQEQLNKLGYKVAVDGKLGPETIAAAKTFQKKSKLDDDGIPGPVTAKAMFDAIAKIKDNPVNILGVQKILGAKQDNVWGEDTEKRYQALRASSNLGGVKFPYGIEYTQGVVGTKKDGVWGDNSRLAHDKKIIQLQKELARLGVYGLKIDGKWENGTDTAIKKIRSRARA